MAFNVTLRKEVVEPYQIQVYEAGESHSDFNSNYISYEDSTGSTMNHTYDSMTHVITVGYTKDLTIKHNHSPYYISSFSILNSDKTTRITLNEKDSEVLDLHINDLPNLQYFKSFVNLYNARIFLYNSPELLKVPSINCKIPPQSFLNNCPKIIGLNINYNSEYQVNETTCFSGCTSLKCITGTIQAGYFSNDSPYLADWFSNCPVLEHPTGGEASSIINSGGGGLYVYNYDGACTIAPDPDPDPDPDPKEFKIELEKWVGGNYYFDIVGDDLEGKDPNGNPVDISSSPVNLNTNLTIEGNNVTSVLIGNIDTAIIHKLGPDLTNLDNFAHDQGTGITPLTYFRCHDDFSQITSMIQAFKGCNLTSFPSLDTSNVTKWSACFASNNFITGPTLDYSSATEVNNMFSYNSEMTCLPNMDTRQVPPKTDWDFVHIFWDCPVLLHPTSAEINLLEVKTGGSGLDYSHDCSAPPIPQVKDIYYTRDQNLNNFMVSYENNNSYRITLNEQRNG